MNHSAPLMKEVVVALGVATIVVVVGVTVAVCLLRRKLVG
jgi:ABC-type Fe3+ transport system permease subunit